MSSRKNLLITTIVGVVSLLFLLRVFTKNYEKLIETRRINVDQAGEFISEKFKEEVVKNIQALQNLKGRLEETNGSYFENWEFDAQLMRSQSESILFVEWIDSNMVIQRVNPVEGNENALGLYIGDIEYRASDWNQAVKDSAINMTKWAKLVQGPNAFLVDEPVYYEGVFQGTITAGMNFNTLFDEILSERGEYFVTVSDQYNNRFYASKDSSQIHDFKDYLYTRSFTFFEKDKPWTFTLQPNSSIVERTAFQRIGIGLALGLTLSILLTIAVYFILESKTSEKRLKTLNEDLNIEKEKAETSSKVKSEFMANMSHEIRTPLSAIMGLIEILKHAENKNEMRKYMDLLEMSSNNLITLLGDILDINKIESGNLELVEVEFEIKEVLDSITSQQKQIFEEKGLYLRTDFSNLEHESIKGDPGKFTQVIGNLIRNAFKFTDKGGLEIVVTGKKINKHLNVVITFKDTGIGIAKDKQQYIFERFTQIDSGLNRRYEGSGLGLSITQQIIQLMGGRISLESEEGKGATFEIELNFPLAEIESERNEVIEETTSMEDFSSFRALVVDDMELNQLVLEKILERYKLRVDRAKNGKVAVSKAAANKYDIIFMDIHMPKMDGFEATKEIKSLGITTPIITVTGNVTKEAMAKAKELGMKEFITKPYTSLKIYSVLNTYLKKAS